VGGDGELCLRHLPLPASYGAANWPLRHVALSADGRDVAVAGRRGAALCCLATGRWRVFGDISQARRAHPVTLASSVQTFLLSCLSERASPNPGS
jgi:hypothetical protein